jgi:hypothetical protein
MLATIAAFPHASPRNPIFVQEYIHPLAVLGMEKNSAVISTFADRAVKGSCAFYINLLPVPVQFSRGRVRALYQNLLTGYKKLSLAWTVPYRACPFPTVIYIFTGD